MFSSFLCKFLESSIEYRYYHFLVFVLNGPKILDIFQAKSFQNVCYEAKDIYLILIICFTLGQISSISSCVNFWSHLLNTNTIIILYFSSMVKYTLACAIYKILKLLVMKQTNITKF